MLQLHRTQGALLGFLALMTAACIYPAHGQDGSRAVRRGERLVSARCAMCHAIGRADASPHRAAPPLRIVLQHYPTESLQESLIEGLTSGHPDMPTFRFADGDAAAILAYLEAIRQR